MAMVGIHEVFTSTTIIIQLEKDEQRGSASGFFFSIDGKKVYLVTNKHVIYGSRYGVEGAPPRIDQIKLNLHTNVQDLKQNQEVIVDLFEKGNKKWFEHDKPSIDIVLIPLNLDRAKFVFCAIDGNYFNDEDTLIYFEKIFVMGYPRGWYDTVNNLPITRVGNLSSPFKVPFLGEPYMLGDVQTHEGMSGGPVFMDLQDYTVRLEDGKFVSYPGRRKFLLVGVNSGQPRLPGYKGRPNLIVIWFPEKILEIIESQSKRA
jgi:hypothetical protein